MKAKILLLTLAVLISGVSFSNNISKDENTKCEKMVLKKIKRKMQTIDLQKYLEEGEQSRFLITCKVNSNNIVEVVDVMGINEELKNQIIETLAKYPVECDSKSMDSPFRFSTKFVLLPR